MNCKAWQAALVLALLLSACGPPRRVVIKDEVRLFVLTLSAISELESYAECDLFDPITIGGRDRDWRGMGPPIGTITVETVPYLPNDWVGAHMGSHFGIRGRILLLPKSGAKVLAHELLHGLGLEHAKDGIMRSGIKKGTIQEVLRRNPEHVREQIQALCM